jgi:hypothetical protein
MLTAAPVVIYVMQYDYRKKANEFIKLGNVNSFYNFTLNSAVSQFKFQHFLDMNSARFIASVMSVLALTSCRT